MLKYIKKKIFEISNQYNQVDKGIVLPVNSYISGSILSGRVQVDEGVKLYKAHLEGSVIIGRYTSIWGPNTSLIGRVYGIEVGNFCSIARNVTVQEDYHNPQLMSTYFIERNVFGVPSADQTVISKGRIVVGHDVWIGAGSILLSGVNVGSGAIVGAGAVVTKDIPPFAVVAGNPAKIIRFRFPDQIIKEIEEMKWWNWPIEEIKGNLSAFQKLYPAG